MIEEGTAAPDFERVNQRGEPVRLSGLRGRVVVLYFYPRSDTPGCTMEACGFRDVYQDLAGNGCEVIGVSSDTLDQQQAFASRHRLPFHLLTDEDGELRRLYKVPKTLGIIPGRVTYIIDRQGVVRKAINSQFRPLRHVQEALESVMASGGKAPDSR